MPKADPDQSTTAGRDSTQKPPLITGIVRPERLQCFCNLSSIPSLNISCTPSVFDGFIREPNFCQDAADCVDYIRELV
jgi:hypothetical protein